MKYSDDLRQKVIQLVADGHHSISEICDLVGITRAEFVVWKKEDQTFADYLKIAEDVKYQNRLQLAWNAQRRLLEGYEYREVTEEVEYIPGENPEDPVIERVKSRKVVMRHRGPSTSAVIHALRSLDPRFNQPDKRDYTSGGEPIKSLPNIFINVPTTTKSLKPADTN